MQPFFNLKCKNLPKKLHSIGPLYTMKLKQLPKNKDPNLNEARFQNLW